MGFKFPGLDSSISRVLSSVEGQGRDRDLEGSKISRTYSRYVTLMCNLVDVEPTYFEEATKKKEWMDAML